MIALSSRYVIAIAILGVLAAVPVAVHSSGRRDVDDCADPGALRATLLIPGSRPEFNDKPLKPGELMRSEGSLEPQLSRFAPPLRFAVQRSFEPAEVTSRPGRLVVQRLEAQEHGVRILERGDVRLPVHWLEERTRGMPTFAAFFYVYENRPVEGPYRALIGSALRRLAGGPRPLSVFAVGGSAPEPVAEQARRQAEDWLFEAWDHYQVVCIPPEKDAPIDGPGKLR
jgi:hypothetical protein